MLFFSIMQDQPKNIFNKASLMNAGFMEARSLGARSALGGVKVPFDCYLFHDVDMLPEDDRNFYGCGARLPRHVGAFVDKWNYKSDIIMMAFLA
jgi:N-terminal region of glycosyl transferase group 7